MNRFNKHQPKAFLGTLLTTFIVVVFSMHANAKEIKASTKNATPDLFATVSIQAKKGEEFLLWADYYKGEQHAGGVLVMHDCNSDRRAYSSLANALAQAGMHTLLIDLRGYGESVAPGFSRETVKKKSPDIVTFQSEMSLIKANWSQDLLAAHQFLLNKIDKTQGVAIVTSGCSSAYGVALAEKIHISASVMITPQMSYSDKERFKNLIDTPNYFITSSHHQDSFASSQELFNWNGDKRSKIQIFKGSRHDQQLLSSQTYLVKDIALWIKSIR